MTKLWPFSFDRIEIFITGQFGRKQDFQEFLGGQAKMVIAWQLFGSIDPIFYANGSNVESTCAQG